MTEEQHYAMERAFTEVDDLIDDFIDAFENGREWKKKAREFIEENRKALVILEKICNG